MAFRDDFGTARHGTARHGTARHGTARHGTARHGTARHGTARHGTALHCTALHCTALHCTALHCTALHCTALHCTALHCTAERTSLPICFYTALTISGHKLCRDIYKHLLSVTDTMTLTLCNFAKTKLFENIINKLATMLLILVLIFLVMTIIRIKHTFQLVYSVNIQVTLYTGH